MDLTCIYTVYLVLVLCGSDGVFGTTTTWLLSTTTPSSTNVTSSATVVTNLTSAATVATTLASNVTSSIMDDTVNQLTTNVATTTTPTRTTMLSINASTSTAAPLPTLTATTATQITSTAAQTTTTTTTTAAAATTREFTITTSTVAPFNCSVPGSRCMNGGTCTALGACVCTDRFTGEQCKLLNLCNATTCQNNGTCHLVLTQGYMCSCTTGDPQLSCALNTRKECTKILPQLPNVITCVDYIDGHNLICRPGYTGDACQRQATDDFCQRKDADHCSNINVCKPRCNVDQCNGTRACTFTIEPYSHPAYINRSQCIEGFADSWDDPGCTTEDLLFDAFDLTRRGLDDCSPYFNTICTDSFNDGVCNEHCNHEDCLWDGWDCAEKSFPGSIPVPVPVGGRVVVELNSVNKFEVKKVLGLLLRSKVEVEPGKTSVPHVYAKVSSTNFTKILSVGRFLAAAFAKLPDLPAVTDVFVCENGTYSYEDKCKRMCSPNCAALAGEDYCHPASGQCSHGCVAGFWGDMCNTTCPALCADACDSYGRCACKSGSFWSDATKDCMPCSDNCQSTCDALNGSCTCKPEFYGRFCGLACSVACKDGRCNAVNGECSSGCERGLHGIDCSLNCSTRCPDCEQSGGKCEGRCVAGYEGRNCDKLVKPPTTDNTGVVIAVILAIVIVVIIIVTTYCCWKRRQSGDYVLEDEEKEPAAKMAPGGTGDQEVALLLEPGVPALGRSTDMIDMDERPTPAGIYQGPNRATVVATNISDIESNDHLPITEVSANGDVSISLDVKLANATPQEPVLAIETGDAANTDAGDVTDDDEDDAEDDTASKPGSDVDKDDDASSRNSDLPPSVPLATSGAPLASEEDILLSKENLLEATRDHGESDAEASANDDQPEDEKRASSRKSSTSSKSSSTSSSSKSSHKSSKSNLEPDMTSGEPTTEI